MADLTRHSRCIETVFDRPGDKEDDITYSLGWGLGQSEALAHALLTEAYGDVEQWRAHRRAPAAELSRHPAGMTSNFTPKTRYSAPVDTSDE